MNKILTYRNIVWIVQPYVLTFSAQLINFQDSHYKEMGTLYFIV